MKKVLLFVWLMAGFMSVEAQKLYVMPEVGMSAVKREYDPLQGNVDWFNRIMYIEDSWRAAPKVGVGVMFHPKSEAFAIQSGVYYTSQSYSLRHFSCNYYYHYPNSWEEPVLHDDKSFLVDDINSTRHLLQVPLMARFSWKVSDDVRLFTSVGGSIGFQIGSGGSIKGTRLGFSDKEVPANPYGNAYGNGYGYGDSYGYGGSEGIFNNWLYPYDVYGDYYGNGMTVAPTYRSENRKITWALSAQVGVEYHKMVITAGYDLDFGKEDQHADFGLRYQTLALSVGYKFRLK